MISIGWACGLRKDGNYVYFVDANFNDFHITTKNGIEFEVRFK